MKNTSPKGERFEELTAARRGIKAEIAKVLGVSPSVVNHWRDRGVPAVRALAVAEILGCRPDEISELTMPVPIVGGTIEHRHGAAMGSIGPPIGHQNIEPVGYHNNDMPLISFVNAGTWCESPDNFAPGDAEEWLPRPKGVGARAFALRVEGDSMTSPYPGQRSYPNGALIYVDPDRALTNGARVIARTPDGEYTFKVYTEDAGRRYLKPINPQYPMIDITEDTHICGVVAGSYIPE